eukprot:2016182-Amphidinium_carterae.2
MSLRECLTQSSVHTTRQVGMGRGIAKVSCCGIYATKLRSVSGTGVVSPLAVPPCLVDCKH